MNQLPDSNQISRIEQKQSPSLSRILAQDFSTRKESDAVGRLQKTLAGTRKEGNVKFRLGHH